MTKNLEVMILNLPSPPHQEVNREWAGGFGTAFYDRRRKEYGHSTTPEFLSFLPYFCSVLSELDCEFDFLDCQMMKLNDLQMLSVLKDKSPEVIFSLVSLPSLKKDLELFNEIKKSLPNTSVVAIGTVCKVMPEEILLKSDVDAVIRNFHPYIYSLKEFVCAVQHRKSFKKVPGISFLENKKLINTPEPPNQNFDDIPAPLYTDLKLEGYGVFADMEGNRYNYIPVMGSRGCPYRCFYCPYILGYGNKWMHRSPERIVDEIEYLYGSRNVKGFLFRDQSFSINKEYAHQICDEIIQRKLDIAWFCEARVDNISKELLEKMRKAGCKRIHYGVETGDPELIKIAKPEVLLGNVGKTFQLSRKIGIFSHAHFIIGWPYEKVETIRKGFDFLLKLSPDDVDINILTPYPGTKLYQIAQKHSWILTQDWSNYTSHDVVMKTNLSPNQIYRMKKNLYQKFLIIKMYNSISKFPYDNKNIGVLIRTAKRIIGTELNSYV